MSNRTLTAAASASSAASGLWACPGSWCRSSRWETPGCQWLKSTPAFRLECSNCSSGRPYPRNTSPKPRSKHRWDQKFTNDGVTGARGMFFFSALFPFPVKKCIFHYDSTFDISCMTYWFCGLGNVKSCKHLFNLIWDSMGYNASFIQPVKANCIAETNRSQRVAPVFLNFVCFFPSELCQESPFKSTHWKRWLVCANLCMVCEKNLAN